MNPPTTASPKYHLNLSDWQKSLLMAIGAGIVLPLSLIVQTQGFSIAHANWSNILDIALTGAFTGCIVYLAKNYFSDESGKFAGKIG